MLRRCCCLFSVEVVCDISHENVASIQTQHRDAFTTVSEDFNHVDLTSDLIGFVQYVDCPTRENKTLDQLYTHSTLQIGRVLVLWKTSCVVAQSCAKGWHQWRQTSGPYVAHHERMSYCFSAFKVSECLWSSTCFTRFTHIWLYWVVYFLGLFKCIYYPYHPAALAGVDLSFASLIMDYLTGIQQEFNIYYQFLM